MLGSFLFVLTFSFAAFSETELLLSPDEKLWLAQHPELRLGVIASRLPFEALSSERKQEGIASDYANWLEKTLGIRFVAHPVPDTGLHLPFGEGKLDVHLSAVDTPESRKTMLFTRPYLELPLVLFMMNDAPFVNGLQDMKGKRVAAVGERLLDILKDCLTDGVVFSFTFWSRLRNEKYIHSLQLHLHCTFLPLLPLPPG